jgi:hypothetical protein
MRGTAVTRTVEAEAALAAAKPVSSSEWERLARPGAALAAAFLLGCFVASVWATRHWPLVNDPALMHYVVFLMERGMAPYRQIGDYNLPGAYAPEWFSMQAAAVLHISFAAMWRVMDAGAAVLAGVAMVRIARPYSWFAGVFAGVLFALYHGRDGIEHAGQRDLWATMLLLWAVALLFTGMRLADRGGRLWRIGCFGAFIGAATTIKPFEAVFLLLLLPLLWRQRGERPGVLAAAGFAGFSIPLGGALLFVLHWHAGEAMLQVLRVALPYHASLHRGSLLQLLWASTIPSVCKMLLLLFLTAVLAGGWRSGMDRLWRRAYAAEVWNGAGERLLLVLCALFGLLSFVVQGKGYPYHRYPLVAFLFLLAGLEFVAAVRSRRVSLRIVGALGLVFGVLFCAPSYLRGAAQSRSATPAVPALEKDLLAIAGAGGVRSLDGEVQCVDTVFGCTDTLLQLRLRQATGTLYDEMLFPQTPAMWGVSYDGPRPGSPVPAAVVTARQRFEVELLRSPPRVVLVSSWLFPQGPGDYRKLALWPWFQGYLASNYNLVSQQDFGMFEPGPLGFRMYVRRAKASQ